MRWTTSSRKLVSHKNQRQTSFTREMRDKIVAASKKKGMWMGGMPPLEYEVKDRELAAIVDIYRRYLVLKSIRRDYC